MILKARLVRLERQAEIRFPYATPPCPECGQTKAERIYWRLEAFPPCPTCGAATLTMARLTEWRAEQETGRSRT